MYKEKMINGLVWVDSTLHGQQIMVRMTKDEIGKSMSIQFANCMVQIPLEPIEKELKGVLR